MRITIEQLQAIQKDLPTPASEGDLLEVRLPERPVDKFLDEHKIHQASTASRVPQFVSRIAEAVGYYDANGNWKLGWKLRVEVIL